LLGQPFPLGHKLALHLADKRHRTAEPEQAETQKINNDLADWRVGRCHRNDRSCWPHNTQTTTQFGTSCVRSTARESLAMEIDPRVVVRPGFRRAIRHNSSVSALSRS